MSKKKICYGLFIFFTIFITAATINSKAHAPEAIDWAYNSNTQNLTVSITHGTDDANSHYVESVRIVVDGSTVLTESYTSQPDLLYFIYEYSITATNGAEIQALAICNLGGSLTTCIVVGGGSCEEDGGGGGAGIPGYLGLWIIIGVSVIVLTTIIKKKIKRISK